MSLDSTKNGKDSTKPSKALIRTKSGKGIPRWLQKDFDDKTLMNRFDRLERRSKLKIGRRKRLTCNKEQKHAISLMCDFLNRWPTGYIAKQVGVEISTLIKWRQKPYFMAELDAEITRRKTLFRREAFSNVYKALKEGSMKDTWRYLKMTGDLKEQIDVNKTIKVETPETELDKEIEALSNELGITISSE